MSLVLITGICGLVGSSAAEFFSEQGFDVVGIDNDRRKFFFGEAGSTIDTKERLLRNIKNISIYDVDIRDTSGLERIYSKYGTQIDLVIHTAAQPSHDWASSNLIEDFTVNANGTLTVLDVSRRCSPKSVFIHLSTNKVYGDYPNDLEYIEESTRFSPLDNKLKDNGFDENVRIDNVLHSFFGVSKAAADLLTQEFGKNFGYQTTVLRGGCLTGPSHAGVEAHGFLSYLVKALKAGKEYRVIGYGGKQVRDNIHSDDLSRAFFEIYKSPNLGNVFNIGGGIYSNCSVLEAINTFEKISGSSANYTIDCAARTGDHKWWVSDISKFITRYPNWSITKNVEDIIKDIYNT